MGDKETLAKARRELEGLYAGVEDSLDLSFKDFAGFQRPESTRTISPIREDPKENVVDKSPSLDFRKGLQGAVVEARKDQQPENVRTAVKVQYIDASFLSTIGGGGRRRQGIPHSNICAVCTVYIYFWKNRCLVCGKVYCRQCVDEGMGDMSEGRKCIECLGRRLSQRYIQKAGQTGCCGLRYSSSVKQQELKWAEKGPRRSEEKQYGKSYMTSPQYGRSTVESRSMRPVSVSQFGNFKVPISPRSSVGDGNALVFASPKKFPSAHAFPL